MNPKDSGDFPLKARQYLPVTLTALVPFDLDKLANVF